MNPDGLDTSLPPAAADGGSSATHGKSRRIGLLRPALIWAWLEIARFSVKNLVYMIYRSKVELRLRKYRKQGRWERVEKAVWKIGEPWARSVVEYFGCDVEVVGRENLPRTGPVIVMCNHQGYYDIPLLYGYLGRHLGFVIKRKLYRVPGISYWMRRIHCVGIDREDGRGVIEIYEGMSREIAAHDRCMVIFPEGTRTRHPDGQIGPFRRGSLRAASRESIPVLPVTIDGTRYLTKPADLASSKPGRRKIRMLIDPPRPTRPMNAAESKKFMDDLRHTITENWERIRVQWPHAPDQEGSPAEAE